MYKTIYMGFGVLLDDEYEPNSTPKLSLSRLPSKLRGPIQMLTPPLHPSLSVPFQWEEAPGKPRATAKSMVASSPAFMKRAARKFSEMGPTTLWADEIIKTPSPTSTLDGPYVGRSLSLACTFSFRKGLVKSRDDGLKSKERSRGRNFGSERFGSVREEEVLKMDNGGSFGLSRSLGDVFKSEESVKGMSVGRKRSLFTLSSFNSNLWGDICASLKQAVPWRRRRHT